MSGRGLGAFASGLGTGMLTASQIDRNVTKSKKEKLELGRMEKEQPVLDKELELRGAKADFEKTELGFKTTMQEFEQGTRKLLAQQQRNQAQVGVGQSAAAVANQPDELAVAREKLNDQVLNSTLRQTANIYRVAKLGGNDAAVEMFNNSMLVQPGQKAKGVRFEDVDVPGKDGQPGTKAKVLSIEMADGKVRRLPVSRLEALDAQFGAQYQKVGNTIVRINRDGSTEPVYEEREVGANSETGDLYVKRGKDAGKVIPARGGINGGAAAPGSKLGGRLDDAVTKGRTVIDKYFGISEFTRLDDSAQPAYNAAVARMGALVRGGTAPEKAANQALLEAKDGRLNPDGTPKAAPAPQPGGGAPAAGGLPRLW